MNEWISVEDRLPKCSHEFLCHHDGQVFSAVYESDGKFFMPSLNHEVMFYVEVTHWMPLPEPPTNLTKEAD